MPPTVNFLKFTIADRERANAFAAAAENAENIQRWLDEQAEHSPHWVGLIKALIKAKAEPRLPHPDSLSDKQLIILNNAAGSNGLNAYRALYDDLTKPKTKTVWDITVFGLPKQRAERQEHVLAVIREFGEKYEITITPQQVPAD